MIVKWVSYQLPTEMSREEVVEAAQDVAKEWLQHPDLIRKDFLLDEHNRTYGYYVFPSREIAEAAHDEAFLNRLKQRFNVEPEIQYFDYLLCADVKQQQVFIPDA